MLVSLGPLLGSPGLSTLRKGLFCIANYSIKITTCTRGWFCMEKIQRQMCLPDTHLSKLRKGLFCFVLQITPSKPLRVRGGVYCRIQHQICLPDALLLRLRKVLFCIANYSIKIKLFLSLFLITTALRLSCAIRNSSMTSCFFF